eukprot:TRINITY_DN26940_c0_g1_i1.p1 TRINITY_DN26940_c0_g1~~TRINITY_DN26940_c0_g1_i1.p1  ORF type:complete len:380 (-),score=83.15 TRINITY_DN26940_c0_g1_i1:76-1215(-)
MPLTFDANRRQVFVVGNDAADSDSLVSAYAIAALLDSEEVQGIALAQIPREEFRLRGDSLALFKQAGAQVLSDGSPQRLHFWNEVDWTAADSLATRSLVLTDHNKMTPMVAQHFDGRVEWVIDHHAGGGSYPDARADIDEGIASASSLVVEKFLEKGKGAITKELAVLLAGVILLDSRNFCPKENKGTPRDRSALDALTSLDEAIRPQRDAATWYDELMEARKDVSHLSVRELMLVDTKVVTISGLSVAFSSIFGSLQEVVSKAGGPTALQEEGKKLATSRGWQAVVCLFAKDIATKRKGLAFMSVDESGSKVMLETVERLQGVPGNLPDVLKENPLFETQGILTTGFDLQPSEELEPLMAFSLIGAVSRKTLLPCASL